MSKPSSSGRDHVLSINGGSSSVKFAVYTPDELRRLFHGSFERIGLENCVIHFKNEGQNTDERREIGAADHRRVVEELIGWLEAELGLSSFSAVGHRVVHGGARFGEPV